MTAPRVLLIERPGRFRDALVSAVAARGGEADTVDDAMAALASSPQTAPGVVVVGDAAGPPDPASLCRILQRRYEGVRVYCVTSEPPSNDSPGRVLPRHLPARLLVAQLLQRADGEASARPSAGTRHSLAAGQFGQMLLWLCAQRATGRLHVETAEHERCFELLRGIPVFSGGGALSERFGAVALAAGAIADDQLDPALQVVEQGGPRLGQALVQLGAIDQATRFGLLSQQHRLRLAAACRAGQAVARFVPAPGVAARVPLFPVHPMTAIAMGFDGAPAAAREAYCDAIADTCLSLDGATLELGRFLEAMGVADALDDLEAGTGAGSLRRALDRTDSAFSGDVLLLTVLASGMVQGPTDDGARAGLAEGLTAPWPPPLGLVAGASVPPPEGALQAELEAYLHPPPAAGSECFSGGVVTPSFAQHGLCGSYLDVFAAATPQAAIGAPSRATPVELQLALHRALDALDAGATSGDGPSARIRLQQLRHALDRAAAALPASTEAGPIPSVPAAVATGARPAPDTAGAPQVLEGVTTLPALPIGQRPANQQERSDPPEPGIPAPLESLVRQGRWQDLIRAVEDLQRSSSASLAPGVTLLYAVALREAAAREPAAGAAGPSPDALGIDAVARLLQVGQHSASALVIAKRVLRQRPQGWQRQTTTRVSVWATAIALTLGTAAGLLLNELGLF